MHAMVLKRVVNLSENRLPLSLDDVPLPQVNGDEVLIKVSVCGVCHTELDEIEGRIHIRDFPLILGHQVVGKVVEVGPGVTKDLAPGVRVGVGWIFHACGHCEFCKSGNENLCADFKATGLDAPGGYAEYLNVSARFAYPIPDIFEDAQAAPLLCAGAIGYRSLELTGIKNKQILGLTGFGASGHLVLKMSKFKFPETRVFVFARSRSEQEFARDLGADWAGDTTAEPPGQPHAVIDTTPVWKPVVSALRILRPGGRLVINAIRKENADQEYLTRIDYQSHLWLEKEIKSVANVTRMDVIGFLKLAAQIPILPEYQEYDLIEANRVLMDLKEGKIRGAKVLRIS
jgi:propanol-preferring alcohol dehydrogenase